MRSEINRAASVREIVKYLDSIGAAGSPTSLRPGGMDEIVRRAAAVSSASVGDAAFLVQTHVQTARPGSSLLIATSEVAEWLLGITADVGVVVQSADPRDVLRCVIERFLSVPTVVGVSSRASVHPSARLAADVAIAEHCVVGAGCVIGSGSVLHPGVVLYEEVAIGERVEVHSGTVLGSPGFGARWDAAGTLRSFPHVGGLIVEDDVEIGANCVVARGSLQTTRLGRGSLIGALTQISHNVQLGAQTHIGAHCSIAGSAQIGDCCWVGPSASIREHVVVGDGSLVAMGAVVVADVPARAIVRGVPARLVDAVGPGPWDARLAALDAPRTPNPCDRADDQTVESRGLPIDASP